MHDTTYWRVYGLGEIGILEGVIYDNWEQVSELPEGAKLIRHTLDFGFTNAPSALVDIYRYEGGFLLDERLYLTGQKERASSQRTAQGGGAQACRSGWHVRGAHAHTDDR